MVGGGAGLKDQVLTPLEWQLNKPHIYVYLPLMLTNIPVVVV